MSIQTPSLRCHRWLEPSGRGKSVVAHLCRSAFFEAFESGAGALVFLLEEGLIRLLREHYALPVRSLGKSRYYIGGDVTPAGVSLSGHAYLETARANPGYWQWMTEYCSPQTVSDLELPIVLTEEDRPAEPLADLLRRTVSRPS